MGMFPCKAYILVGIVAAVCASISDGYSFLEPTKHKGCVDIVGIQGGCCDRKIHGSCMVFRNENDFCHCEGTCFLDEFCCADIKQTGCVAVKVDPDEVDKKVLAALDKKLTAIRSKVEERRKNEAVESKHMISKRSSSMDKEPKEQAKNSNPRNTKRKATSQDESKVTHTQKRSKVTENEASWYLTKTGQQLNAGRGSDTKQHNVEETSIHAQKVMGKEKDASKEEQRNPDNSGPSMQKSKHPMLDTLQQILQGISNLLVPKRSEKTMANSASQTSNEDTTPSFPKWTTPILAQESAEPGQPRGPLIHRPIGEFANTQSEQAQGSPIPHSVGESASTFGPKQSKKVSAQARSKWKNTIHNRYGTAMAATTTTSGREGEIIQKGPPGSYGKKRPATDSRANNARSNPWLARRRMSGRLQNTMVKVKTSPQMSRSNFPRDSGFGKPNQMQRRQNRLVKRDM